VKAASLPRPARAALQRVPWAGELFQRWRAEGRPPASGYRLDRLAEALPGWVEAVARARARLDGTRPRRVLVFAYLSWWLEHAMALSLLLAALGHEVWLAFLPHRRWTEDPTPFDLRRQSAYLLEVWRPAASVLRLVDFSRVRRRPLDADLEGELRRQSLLDVQYTLQREEVDLESTAVRALLELRLRRNRLAAAGAQAVVPSRRIEAVVLPNGSILEFGAVYHAARALGAPVATYEFGEQRQRLWLARDAQVMRQDTSELWAARGGIPLETAEREALQSLYAARRVGARWAHFARQWQTGVSEGAEAARRRLGLDPTRPVALVCTNVVGDSLALDRQVFTRGMSDWLVESVRRLAARPGVQTVVRVHPGEMLGAGHPSEAVVRGSLPSLPADLHLVPPDSPVNTYDLIELAHVGLVYTSTVGLEMAMAGVPVLVAGATHFRGKGFTDDPASWTEFGEMLERRLAEPLGRRLPAEQIDLARRYAYRFFFEYPRPYPWHLIGFWKDVAERPLEGLIVSDEMEAYRPTLEAFVGRRVVGGRES